MSNEILDALVLARGIIASEGIYPTALKQIDAALSLQGEAVPVGVADNMPGTSGFTMAAFKAVDVPVGTKLFTSPPIPTAQQSELIRKCAELAPEECKTCIGYGYVDANSRNERLCPDCKGSGGLPNKAILALLPEEERG